MRLAEDLVRFQPGNEQEEHDLALMRALVSAPNVLTRENKVCHFTASSWIVSRDRHQVLAVYHRIYQSWAWTGGHADGEDDLLSVAIREAREETGIHTIQPLLERPFSAEILTVDGHEKRGEYVPSHLHLNLTYLLCGDETEPIRAKQDENKAVRWFLPEAFLAACSEQWMIDRIYKKLITRFSEMVRRGEV